MLPCKKDPFAVAVVRSGIIVDHILLIFVGPAKKELALPCMHAAMATPPANHACAGCKQALISRIYFLWIVTQPRKL